MENNSVNIIIEPVREGVILPEYNDPEDAAMDVFVNLPEGETSMLIRPGETALVPLGFKLGIPQGWLVSLRPRSGISLKTKLRIANAPGTIDTNYKGQLYAAIANTSATIPGPGIVTFNLAGIQKWQGKYDTRLRQQINPDGAYELFNGDKIAQILPERRYRMTLELGRATDIGTDRGGGYGSSGTQAKPAGHE
jgi:dUTP pyrophosphatase